MMWLLVCSITCRLLIVFLTRYLSHKTALGVASKIIKRCCYCNSGLHVYRRPVNKMFYIMKNIYDYPVIFSAKIFTRSEIFAFELKSFAYLHMLEKYLTGGQVGCKSLWRSRSVCSDSLPRSCTTLRLRNTQRQALVPQTHISQWHSPGDHRVPQVVTHKLLLVYKLNTSRLGGVRQIVRYSNGPQNENREQQLPMAGILVQVHQGFRTSKYIISWTLWQQINFSLITPQ